MRCVVSILMFAVFAVPAQPDCRVRQRVVVQRQVVVEQAVVAAAVVPVAQFVPIAVPTYGVSYVGGNGYGQSTEIAKLRESVDRLERTLLNLAAGKPPEAVAAPKAVEPTMEERAVTLVQGKCAQCHAEGKAPKGPGGKPFLMFDIKGQLNVSPKLLGVIYRSKTSDGKVMPPPSSGTAFSDEEVAIILDGLGR